MTESNLPLSQNENLDHACPECGSFNVAELETGNWDCKDCPWYGHEEGFKIAATRANDKTKDQSAYDEAKKSNPLFDHICIKCFSMNVQEVAGGGWKCIECDHAGTELDFNIKELERRKRERKFYGDWCDEKEHNRDLDGPMTGDGQCICGVHKHHVHCEHGYIIQVG